jgi:gluconokinase
MIVIVMGTTGSGKTTIGELLARRTGWEFADADNFHPAANVEKMGRGFPLDDADRAPWLVVLREKIAGWLSEGRPVILACSALKESYREQLLVSAAVKLVYLRGDYELFAERIQARKGHFAKENLLAGQFRDLEEPTNALTLDSRLRPEELVSQICAQLNLSCHPPRLS